MVKNKKFYYYYYSSDGRAVRASAVDKSYTLFTASLLDAQHLRNILKNKPTSSLVPLGKALIKIPPSWCGRQGRDGNR